jgi:hypothetical protein
MAWQRVINHRKSATIQMISILCLRIV